MKDYTLITETLIQAIEQNPQNWVRSWVSQKPNNPFTGTVYRNTNWLNLMCDQHNNQRSNLFYCTFNHAKKAKIKVKKGSKSISICYFCQIKDEKTEKIKTVVKTSNVFSFDCLEDCEAKKEMMMTSDVTVDESHNQALEFIRSIKHQTQLGDPGYSIANDVVYMPKYFHFTSTDKYISAYLHELSHWTGHEKRLNRQISNKKGSSEYAHEELIAELSACFLANEFEINYDLEYHASYLQSWLEALKQSPDYLKTAIASATKASNFLRFEGHQDFSRIN